MNNHNHIYIVTRVDWDDRISMCGGTYDRDVFPIRECDGGEHEWDIHKKRFVIDK